VLLPETERLWTWLSRRPELAGFVLVGGTALTLRIAHRLSEDLDFVLPAERLPRVRLERLSREATAAGWVVERRQDPVAEAEFADALLDLDDFQQDHLVNGAVKLTFFVADAELARCLDPCPAESFPRIASLDELFASKALVAAKRSRQRDRFDLLVLMRDQGFNMERFRDVFARAGQPDRFETALQRLCDEVPLLGDEGYSALHPSAPSAEELRAFFSGHRRNYEIATAEKALRASLPP
jgi:hypothetical protein